MYRSYRQSVLARLVTAHTDDVYLIVIGYMCLVRTQLSYFPGIDWRLSWQLGQEVESNSAAALNY